MGTILILGAAAAAASPKLLGRDLRVTRMERPRPVSLTGVVDELGEWFQIVLPEDGHPLPVCLALARDNLGVSPKARAQAMTALRTAAAQ
jgi:hypothetical protein